jgi:tetrahydromethanopterin S-methyltransferase subunit H
MARVSSLPFDDVPEDLQKIMREYDKELGGSEFVQVFAHAPDTFRKFIDFYFPLVSETRGTVDMKLTELARLRVAQRNDCNL